MYKKNQDVHLIQSSHLPHNSLSFINILISMIMFVTIHQYGRISMMYSFSDFLSFNIFFSSKVPYYIYVVKHLC